MEMGIDNKNDKEQIPIRQASLSLMAVVSGLALPAFPLFVLLACASESASDAFLLAQCSLFPAGVTSLILGTIAKHRIRNSQGRLYGQGCAPALLAAFCAVYGLLFVYSAPSLMRSKLSVNEDEAIKVLRIMRDAQAAYNVKHAVFAPTFDLLTLPIPSIQGIKEDVHNHGYLFTLQAEGKHYSIRAIPAEPRHTGIRRFLMDESGRIHYDYGEDAAPSNQWVNEQ